MYKICIKYVVFIIFPLKISIMCFTKIEESNKLWLYISGFNDNNLINRSDHESRITEEKDQEIKSVQEKITQLKGDIYNLKVRLPNLKETNRISRLD